jgi:hypothetical protein
MQDREDGTSTAALSVNTTTEAADGTHGPLWPRAAGVVLLIAGLALATTFLGGGAVFLALGFLGDIYRAMARVNTWILLSAIYILSLAFLLSLPTIRRDRQRARLVEALTLYWKGELYRRYGLLWTEALWWEWCRKRVQQSPTTGVPPPDSAGNAVELPPAMQVEESDARLAFEQGLRALDFGFLGLLSAFGPSLAICCWFRFEFWSPPARLTRDCSERLFEIVHDYIARSEDPVAYFKAKGLLRPDGKPSATHGAPPSEQPGH